MLRQPSRFCLLSLFLGSCWMGRPTPTSPAASPSIQTPAVLQVRLSDEDKAWLTDLIVGGREPQSPAIGRGSQPLGRWRSEPTRRDVSLRGPEQVQDRMRLVTDGPVTTASYNTGAALYEGEQKLLGGDWVRDGAWRAWHANGKPWEEGAYRAGEEDGPWRWWYENGNPQALGTFADGTHVGGWSYYHENGHLMAEGVYEDDRPVGPWRTYHENGCLHSEGRFVNGAREGRWNVYGDAGVLDRQSSGLYQAGSRVAD